MVQFYYGKSKKLDARTAIGRLATIDEIAERTLQRITQDLQEIPELMDIDFMDIFPVSIEHQKVLDIEIQQGQRFYRRPNEAAFIC